MQFIVSQLIFISAFFSVTSSIAFASNMDRGPLPVNLQQIVLGPGCHLVPTTLSNLSCSPAQLPSQTKPQFVANLFIGENFQRINAYRKDLDAKDEISVVNKLLEETKPLEMQAGSALWVSSKYFAVIWTPIQMNFYSNVENQAYPFVDLEILLEKSLRLQGAHRFYFSDWSFTPGLQARGVERSTIYQSLALFDVLADPKLLRISKHESLYLEPGFEMAYENEWRPRFSMFFQNLRVLHSGDEAPTSLSNGLFDSGVAITPLKSNGWGQWDLGVNYRFDRELPNDWQRFQLLSSWSLGMMTTSGSVSENSWGVGVSTSFLSAKTGISFREFTREIWNDHQRKDKTVNLEFGLVF